MYCHLYRKFERFHRPELLDSAKAGASSLPPVSPEAPPSLLNSSSVHSSQRGLETAKGLGTLTGERKGEVGVSLPEF